MKKPKENGFKEVSKKHPRAHRTPWTQEDKDTLEKEFDQGRSMGQLADLLKRTPGAVEIQLRKMGMNPWDTQLERNGQIRCDPPSKDWGKLQPELTSETLELAKLLLESLDDPWELYVQPPLNGHSPDLVLINPHRGVIVIEVVKDWGSNSENRQRIQEDSNQLATYVDQFRELYSPSLKGKIAAGKFVIQGFIAIPFWDLSTCYQWEVQPPKDFQVLSLDDFKKFRSDNTSLVRKLTQNSGKNSVLIGDEAKRAKAGIDIARREEANFLKLVDMSDEINRIDDLFDAIYRYRLAIKKLAFLFEDDIFPTPKSMAPYEPVEGLSGKDLALFGDLKALRKQIANQMGVRVENVFGNRILRVLAVKRPATAAEFQAIWGIGPEKLESFGEKFLELINNPDRGRLGLDLESAEGLHKLKDESTWKIPSLTLVGLHRKINDAIDVGRLTEKVYRDLRHWLIEPEFRLEKRKPLPMDNKQKRLVTTRTQSGRRRIRGSAGSGKSLILAARASELVRQDKRVLVLYNFKTLRTYLVDLANRWPNPDEFDLKETDIRQHLYNIRKNISFMHYHGWCRQVCYQAGPESQEKYKGLFSGNPKGVELDHILGERLPTLTAHILQEPSERMLYDAILVDEAQNFNEIMIESVRNGVPEGGEIIITADKAQDVYDRTQTWDGTSSDGISSEWDIRGKWNELDYSYRLPTDLIGKLREFMKRYLPEREDSMPSPIQTEINLAPTILDWIQVGFNQRDNVVDIIRRSLMDQLAQMEDLGISELVFLTSNKEIGIAVVECLEKDDIKVSHTFISKKEQETEEELWEKEAEAKILFDTDNSTVTATTIHSFQGRESRAIVLYLGYETENKPNIAYVGLSRVLASERGSMLSVICAAPRYSGYGSTFPQNLSDRTA